MAELLSDLPENFDFHPLHGAQTYMSNLTLMASIFKQMHSGYNTQIQSGEDADSKLQLCLQALADNLEASATHLPLQQGQANKILKSQGEGGQAFWGGEWAVKTTDFNLTQLDTFVSYATNTPINITLVTPEKIGMHVIVRNSLLSTETVKINLGTETIKGVYEDWEPGDEIELMPGDVFQAIIMDITENNEVWELI